VAATGEAPTAGQPKASRFGRGVPGRSIGSGRDRVAVLPPSVFLGLRLKTGDQPLVDRTQAVHPAGGPIARCDGRDDLYKNVVTILKAAVPTRLHDAEQLSIAHFVDQFGGNTPCFFGLKRLLSGTYANLLSPPQQLGHGRSFWILTDNRECHG